MENEDGDQDGVLCCENIQKRNTELTAARSPKKINIRVITHSEMKIVANEIPEFVYSVVVVSDCTGTDTLTSEYDGDGEISLSVHAAAHSSEKVTTEKWFRCPTSYACCTCAEVQH